MSRLTGIVKLTQMAEHDLPVNKRFLNDVKFAIEKLDLQERRPVSKYYKPSSLNCERQMYYMRKGAVVDTTPTSYNGVGMADTGTRRHVAIQTVLENMSKLGFPWVYVDVEQYLTKQHENGKCMSVKATDKRGMETHLVDDVLHLSFMCDGVVQNTTTGEYYLFEFKNQASFKFQNKVVVDPEHHNQVITYCLCLGLDKALVLYENRNTCDLECPELFLVTENMKQRIADKLLKVEWCVENTKLPDKPNEDKACKWCNYRSLCGKEIV